TRAAGAAHLCQPAESLGRHRVALVHRYGVRRHLPAPPPGGQGEGAPALTHNDKQDRTVLLSSSQRCRHRSVVMMVVVMVVTEMVVVVMMMVSHHSADDPAHAMVV